MKQPLWTADLYGDIWWPNYIGIRKWKNEKSPGRFVFTMHVFSEPSSDHLSRWSRFGSLRFWGVWDHCVHVWAKNHTNHAQTPEKDQVWKHPLPAICVITCVPICGCNSCSKRLWLNKWVKPTTDTVHTQENYIKVNVVNGDVLS